MSEPRITKCGIRNGLLPIAAAALLIWATPVAAQIPRDARAQPGSPLGHVEEVARPPAMAGPSMLATDIQVVKVHVEGNTTIATNQILAQLQTREGRAYDPATVQRDVKKLVNLPWFVDVQTFEEDTSTGKVIVFRVVERPTMRYVEYLGNKEIKNKNLEKETGLKVGSAVDPYMIEEGRRKIEELYRREGFTDVQVTIAEGTKRTDRGVTYVIHEGSQKKIWNTVFEGNDFATDGQLRHRVQTKHGFARIFNKYVDESTLDADKQMLTAYYRSFGFFQAKVGYTVEYNESETWATVRFVIHEGPQYKIRNVSIMGNTLFATDDLSEGLKLRAGDNFEQGKLSGDTDWLKLLYGSRGHVFADIQAEPRFLEDPGQLDLVYRINEGDRFRVGKIIVHIGGDNPHTRIQTALNRFSLRPGDIVDIREIRASERRLMASGLFHSDPARNIYPKISFRIPELEDEYLASETGMTIRGQSPEAVPRVDNRQEYEVQRPTIPQNPNSMDVHLFIDEEELVPAPMQQTLPRQVPTQQTWPRQSPQPSAYQPLPQQTGPVVHTVRKWPFSDVEAQRAQAPEPVTMPYQSSSTWTTGYPDSSSSAPATRIVQQPVNNPFVHQPIVVRGQSPPHEDPWQQASELDFHPSASSNPAARVANNTNGYGGTLPGATGPNSVPAGGVQPAQYTETLPPPSMLVPPGQPVITPYAPTTSADTIIGPPIFNEPEVDIIINTQETQTGRFLLGVGVNSDAGVTGQIMLDEQNFDWRNPPRSWNDVWNSGAFRGDGQRFRLEAAPGTRVQRYLASWSDPYFMDTPVSLGLSGSYYTRRFRDWDEQRTGGRVSLGYQWTASDVSGRLAYRGENVEVFDASNPTLPDLAEVIGNNSLHGLGVTLINDTRDSAFFPTLGHYMELSGEFVTGSFSYPRGSFEYQRYFKLRERADHTGRHVLALTTQVQVTGSNTPLYDRLYAGGVSTMRGFDFRGASPVKQGVQVGGDFLWINSAEYTFPITADDMIHGAVFCDFGTVEPSVKIDDFRVSPGFGLRLTVPAMGPAPIALNFAFPVAKADFDDTQVFSFTVGFLR